MRFTQDRLHQRRECHARDKPGHDTEKMNIELSVEVTGAKEIFARLGGIDAAARQALGQGLIDAAESLRREAASAAPKRTGRLRDSIAVVSDSLDGLAVAAQAPYARFVEFGTRTSPAHPFLAPALFRLRRAVVERVGEILSRAVRAR
jgi:HK97 gp10 family phage protein